MVTTATLTRRPAARAARHARTSAAQPVGRPARRTSAAQPAPSRTAASSSRAAQRRRRARRRATTAGHGPASQDARWCACSSCGRGWATTTAGRAGGGHLGDAFCPAWVTTTSAARSTANGSSTQVPRRRSSTVQSQSGVSARAASTRPASARRRRSRAAGTTRRRSGRPGAAPAPGSRESAPTRCTRVRHLGGHAAQHARSPRAASSRRARRRRRSRAGGRRRRARPGSTTETTGHAVQAHQQQRSRPRRRRRRPRCGGRDPAPRSAAVRERSPAWPSGTQCSRPRGAPSARSSVAVVVAVAAAPTSPGQPAGRGSEDSPVTGSPRGRQGARERRGAVQVAASRGGGRSSRSRRRVAGPRRLGVEVLVGVDHPVQRAGSHGAGAGRRRGRRRAGARAWRGRAPSTSPGRTSTPAVGVDDLGQRAAGVGGHRGAARHRLRGDQPVGLVPRRGDDGDRRRAAAGRASSRWSRWPA